MARAKQKSYPQSLEDLAYADYLEIFDGEVAGTRLENAHLSGRTLENTKPDGASLLECAVTDTVVSDSRWKRARFRDVFIKTTRFVSTNLGESDIADLTVVDSSLAGVDLAASSIRSTVFANCKLDSVNLRQATLGDVAFINCTLKDVDFGAATLTDVTFDGCLIQGLDLTQSTLKKVDLSGAKQLHLAHGAQYLKGATISQVQLIDFAPALAQAAGIIISGG